ncbi:hypothetical protein DOY81_002853 [Sarcophaga bullata]|nr:hypothetical protein DOY81_002853 [Sarcophaga bullata]
MKFKIDTLVTFATVVASFLPNTEAIMEDQILDFLEEIRNRMCYPLFGLPALDPFEIKHIDFKIDNKYIVE